MSLEALFSDSNRKLDPAALTSGVSAVATTKGLGTLGVRQFWAADCREAPDRALDALCQHLRDRRIERVYFSNDVDGTDSAWASATGTPEPGGLTPDFVVELVTRLGREFGLVAGDLMEVAPPLQDTPMARAETLALSVRYVRATLSAMIDTSI